MYFLLLPISTSSDVLTNNLSPQYPHSRQSVSILIHPYLAHS
ncbi:10209_t:CDS:1, partial [Entrophospora sp. SA101]